MPSNRTGLYWFTNDLRLHDQPALMRAVGAVDELVCVFVLEDRWFLPREFNAPSISESRLGFLLQSLVSLEAQLSKLGQQLIVIRGTLESSMAKVIDVTQPTELFCSRHAGWYERRCLSWLEGKYSGLQQHCVDSHTLFDADRLPFALHDLPPTFTQFRKRFDDCKPSKPLRTVSFLPRSPRSASRLSMSLEQLGKSVGGQFEGGETAGLKHLAAYFTGALPSTYKDVRNALDGWENSTKLSPWLANGSLSAREVYSKLQDYERDVVANESTYWIYFELLWREFFQWNAHRHGAALFKLRGTKNRTPLRSFYPERYKKWLAGNTPYPIVNACMNELRQTGFLSNRGRQIVASCFVNELGMDWRYGAAYFEQALLDYDVASNWGNWQYLSGVGADTQPKRHFNLEKQTATFDPDGKYIARWRGEKSDLPLDSVDAADWPIA